MISKTNATKERESLFPSDRRLKKWAKMTRQFRLPRVWPHSRLEDRLRQVTFKLKTSNRWINYNPLVPESTLEHQLKQWFIVLCAAALEFEHGKKLKLSDVYLLMAVAAGHDVSETVAPDFPWTLKRVPYIGEILDKYEKKQLRDLLNALPIEAKTMLLAMFKKILSGRSFLAYFFRATEHLGYLMFALLEAEGGKREYLDVVRNAIAALKAMKADERSIGIRMMYEPLKPRIEALFEHVEESTVA